MFNPFGGNWLVNGMEMLNILIHLKDYGCLVKGDRFDRDKWGVYLNPFIMSDSFSIFIGMGNKIDYINLQNLNIIHRNIDMFDYYTSNPEMIDYIKWVSNQGQQVENKVEIQLNTNFTYYDFDNIFDVNINF